MTRFYLPAQGRGYVQDLPKGADLLTWLTDSGLEEGSWHLGRDSRRESGPLTLELENEDDIVIFKLKFGHLTIPEPPFHKLYLEQNTKLAKFKRLYMAFFRGIFWFVYRIFEKVKR